MPVSLYSNGALRKTAGCPASEASGHSEAVSASEYKFGRDVRLLKPEEYKRVFDQAVRISSYYLTLLARVSEEDHPRLGLAISKKSVKRAVDRNRIKRQIRESFRHHQHLLRGVDIVVMAKAGVKKWDCSELRSTLDDKWRELRKRCKEC